MIALRNKVRQMQLQNFNNHLVLSSSEIEAWVAQDIGIGL